MNILLLGSGGREHALAWKLTQSPLCKNLFIAPGNAGTVSLGINLPFGVNDFEQIRATCIDEKISMVVVGPEDPLVNGITDFLLSDPRLASLLVIGPDKNSAQLEGSKAFAKSFMQRHKIPTAAYKEFTLENYKDGVDYLRDHSLPVVLKADGLAAGKGVVICGTTVEAMAEFELMLQRAKFGEAGRKVVVEEYLPGIEMSVFVLTDGADYVIFPEAKDYKRAKEGDKGPNTGGMGAVSPVPFATPSMMKKIEDKVIKPTVDGLKKDGLVYQGFIFFGLMIFNEEPFVIEYNCRMGDPETEVVIPRLKNDLAELFKACAEKRLKEIKVETDPRTVCTVVAVSAGYPADYQKGKEITGIENVNPEDSIVFQMGTQLKDGKILTNGGRVLCMTSYGRSIFDAVSISKEELEKIYYEGMIYRQDIGYEFE
ncbi:MAG: phosphoribosylamine--glycine ligase [Chitinophagaceae bacterium]|nr:phosphoribosylamine--glycine ligase [Chitinophagaceae bacterium]